MTYLFIGLLFVLFDFSITAGYSVIGLFPDFVGYILILFGILKLKGESRRFKKIFAHSLFMAIYSGLVYILDAVGLVANIGWLALPLILISGFLPLYIIYNIICGLQDIESERGVDLYTKKLYKFFTPMAVTQVVASVFGVSAITIEVSVIASIISAVCAVVFMVYFYKAKTAYNALPPKGDINESFGDSEPKRPWE